MEVQGDVGAKHIIGEYEECVVEVALENTGVITDFDTLEAFAKIDQGQAVSENGGIITDK